MCLIMPSSCGLDKAEIMPPNEAWSIVSASFCLLYVGFSLSLFIISDCILDKPEWFYVWFYVWFSVLFCEDDGSTNSTISNSNLLFNTGVPQQALFLGHPIWEKSTIQNWFFHPIRRECPEAVVAIPSRMGQSRACIRHSNALIGSWAISNVSYLAESSAIHLLSNHWRRFCHCSAACKAWLLKMPKSIVSG